MTSQNRLAQYLSYVKEIDLAGSIPFYQPHDHVLDLCRASPLLEKIAWSGCTMTKFDPTVLSMPSSSRYLETASWRLERDTTFHLSSSAIDEAVFDADNHSRLHHEIPRSTSNPDLPIISYRNVCIDVSFDNAFAHELNRLPTILAGRISVLTVVEASANELAVIVDCLSRTHHGRPTSAWPKVERVTIRETYWTHDSRLRGIYQKLALLCDDISIIILEPDQEITQYTRHRPPYAWPLLAHVAPYVDAIDIQEPINICIRPILPKFTHPPTTTDRCLAADTPRARDRPLNVTYSVSTRHTSNDLAYIVGNTAHATEVLLPWIIPLFQFGGSDATFDFGTLTYVRRKHPKKEGGEAAMPRAIHALVLKLLDDMRSEPLQTIPSDVG